MNLKLIACVSVLAAALPLQAQTSNAAADDGARKSITDSASRIATQPARDVGAVKTTIPPVLQKASIFPYDPTDTKSCTRIAAAIKELNTALGPDFTGTNARKENRAGKLAEAGGQTIVNTLIPFRGLVRELTGSAPQQRRLNVAIDAGMARRGFLRGIAVSKGCRVR